MECNSVIGNYIRYKNQKAEEYDSPASNKLILLINYFDCPFKP